MVNACETFCGHGAKCLRTAWVLHEVKAGNQGFVFHPKFGSRSRVGSYIIKETEGSRRCIAYVYHTTHWNTAISAQNDKNCLSSRALVAPVDSSLDSVFVEVVLKGLLAIASSSGNCVCAVQRVVPKPRHASGDADSSSGGEGAAAIGYFLGPSGLHSGGARANDIAIVRRGRLHFTRSSSPLGTHAFLRRLLSMYHPDQYLGSADVAREVAQYLCKSMDAPVV